MLTIQFETDAITPELLTDPRLQRFWAYWLETSKHFEKFQALSKSDIDPTGFNGYLEYVTLVDVLDDGRDFLYRVYGTGIAEHFGRDMTGAKVSALPEISARFQVYFYQQAYRSRRPVYMVTEGHPNIAVRQWSRLCLPVTKDGESVCQLLNLALPTGLRRKPDHYL